ncbi:DUF6807 family protein [Geminisphaera colitermitum]|uniref:DUF6807 family protein n=1 Tax=Geminisphaera colitermitum TaxID=1148786 RepID=UPI0001964D42|nr:DUF6807 family protein [Geminisphaera colitermitum]
MTTQTPSSLRLQTRWNDATKITAPDGDERALVYRHHPSLNQPGFHPLVTPRGHVLTGWQMSDHVWHRGLWFSIRYVNEDNFWGGTPPFGMLTTSSGPCVEALANDTARMSHQLNWDSPTEGTLLQESREITTRLTPDGITMLDWASVLRAVKDVTLDRSPYTGTMGGYGGLGFRASRELHEAEFLLPDGRILPEVGGEAYQQACDPKVKIGHAAVQVGGEPLPWLVLQGRMDGGADERVSIGIIDHPDNPGSPVPWYAKLHPGRGFSYLNAAFLFHGPKSLKAGEYLKFNYRVFYRDGRWTADEFAKLANEFRQSPRAEIHP